MSMVPAQIDVKELIKSKNPSLAKWLPGGILRYLERILHQDEINALLRDTHHLNSPDFCEKILQYFSISVTSRGTENIPQEGGVIFACNHPLGGMDALALTSILYPVRPDMQFIVNDLLLHLQPLKSLFVGVNKHGVNSKASLQAVNDLFASQRAVCIFPAGLVSRKHGSAVRDNSWKKTFVSQAIKLQQPVVPVYISGSLSSFFLNLARWRENIGIKSNVEMLYLADEQFKLKNSSVEITFGLPLSPEELRSLGSNDKERAQRVQDRVYTLSNE